MQSKKTSICRIVFCIVLIAVLLLHGGTPLISYAGGSGNAEGINKSQNSTDKEFITVENTYINPIYADVITADDLLTFEEATEEDAEQIFGKDVLSGKGYRLNASANEFESVATSASYVREKMEHREGNISFKITTTETDYEALIDTIVEKAMEHTGVSTQGDALRFQYAGWRSSLGYYVSEDVYQYNVTLTVTYYTTAEQETTLSERIDEVLDSLALDGKADYEKIKSIYQYICGGTSYDNKNLNDDNYTLKYTAYAALIDKTAVCQGYAVLLYEMLLESGVDCRVIAGVTDTGEPHAWNIIGLENKYYNADSTWDAATRQVLDMQWFLKSMDDFPKHDREDRFLTDEFMETYPMASESYTSEEPDSGEDYIASGQCGANVFWTLDKEGTLTLSGTGETYEGYTDNPPFLPYNDQLKRLVIEDGITRIGSFVFSNCTGLSGELVFPESLTSLGSMAFEHCSGFTGLVLPESVTYIGRGAFRGCSGFTGKLIIPENVTELGAAAFEGCSGFTGNLVIPEGITKIGNSAFFECTGFTGELVIPKSVTTIEASAFDRCSGFTGSLTLAEGLTEIESCAFRDCSGFSGNFVIPESVKKIGEYAFCGCTGFVGELIIPEGMESIGKSAFQRCSGLSSLQIAESVTELNLEAFIHCTDLKKVINNSSELAGLPWVDGHIWVEEGDLGIAQNEICMISRGTAVLVEPNENSFVKCGDINGDGDVNRADRIYLARYLANWSGYTLKDQTAADVNKDGSVNRADRIYLARYLANWAGYLLE